MYSFWYFVVLFWKCELFYFAKTLPVPTSHCLPDEACNMQCPLSSHPNHSLANLHEMVCTDHGTLQVSELLCLAHWKTYACRWLATPCKLSWQCFWISNILGVLEAPRMTPMKLSTIRFSSGKAESIGHEPPKLGLKGWNQRCCVWSICPGSNYGLIRLFMECFLTSHPNHSLANLHDFSSKPIHSYKRASLRSCACACSWISFAREDAPWSVDLGAPSDARSSSFGVEMRNSLPKLVWFSQPRVCLGSHRPIPKFLHHLRGMILQEALLYARLTDEVAGTGHCQSAAVSQKRFSWARKPRTYWEKRHHTWIIMPVPDKTLSIGHHHWCFNIELISKCDCPYETVDDGYIILWIINNK